MKRLVWSELLRWTRSAAAFVFVLGMSGCGGGSGAVSDMPASREEAARFLTQATFGPTDRDVDAVMSMGYRGWIEDQFRRGGAAVHREAWDRADAEIKAANPAGKAGQREVLDSFWARAIRGDDQLRQRVAFALSQIFVISMLDAGVAANARGVAGYMDMLAKHSFGNYRDLLEAVARHPMMGLYLSHLRNQKDDPATGRVPDQNFAREVMQLFTIGLNQLRSDGTPVLDAQGQPLETYTSDDIVGLSHVFTGFSWYSDRDEDACFYGRSTCQHPDRQWHGMRAYAKFHSTREKRFLGHTVAAGTNAEDSLRAALDVLFHHPNVGPFIGRQLIQRLVTSNPSPAYVQRVAAAFDDNGAGVRGDMKAVVRAILLDPEARSESRARDPAFGKLREPVLRLTTFLRAFNATSDSGRYLVGITDDAGISLGQSPLRAPSVFNFYRPGYVPPGTALAAAGLVAPEMQITHAASVAGYANYMLSAVRYGVGQNGVDHKAPRRDVQVDFSAELAIAEHPDELVERMNQRLLYGQMTEGLRNEIRRALESAAIPALPPTSSNLAQIQAAKLKRVQIAVLLTLVSPEFVVQR